MASFGAISGRSRRRRASTGGVALGVLAHLLARPAGRGAGRAGQPGGDRTGRDGVAVLVVGAVLAIVLGLSGSIAPWLVPPLMATARALAGDAGLPSGRPSSLLTGWALAVVRGRARRLRPAAPESRGA